jgi:cytochrome P450
MDLRDSLAAWGDYDRDDPFPLFARLRRCGPVHPVTLADGHDAWLVVGHAEAKAALNDPRLSKDMHAALARPDAVVAEGLPGPALARHMLAVDPPDHTRLRRLVAGAFALRRIEAQESAIAAIVDDLLDAIEDRGPDTVVDLVQAFAFPLPFTVICELLGVPPCERATLGEALAGLLAPVLTDADLARATDASDRLVRFLAGLVDEKRRDPDGALVSALLDAHDGEDRLTEQELMSTTFQLIIAGHDTTSSLIGNGVVALLTHPEQLARVRCNPQLMANAVEELIRFDAPVPHSTFRYSIEALDIGGVTIPGGAQVIVNLASANRDAAHFERSETLDVERPDVRHLGFGHGIHFCLGAPLARLEGRLALGRLVDRFPRMRLAARIEDLHWGHGDGLVLRGLTSLPIIPGQAATKAAPTG